MIERADIMADVDERYDQCEVALVIEIAFDQVRPTFKLGFRDLRVSISRKIDQIDTINIIEVDGGRLAWFLRDLPAKETSGKVLFGNCLEVP